MKMERMSEREKELLDALKGMLNMFDLVAKKINWGASYLDADAITAMNEAPSEARAVIRRAEGK